MHSKKHHLYRKHFKWFYCFKEKKLQIKSVEFLFINITPEQYDAVNKWNRFEMVKMASLKTWQRQEEKMSQVIPISSNYLPC